MSIVFRKIENNGGKSMREIVLCELRDAIFTNKIQAGDRLVETTIANSMGISRTPVREALRQLESEGLAINIPRKGTVVKGLCLEDASEIYDIREVLEGLAVRKACTYISRIEIRELRQIIRDMDKSIKLDDEAAYYDLNNKYSTIIINSCGNKRLIEQMKSISEYLKSTRKFILMTKERRIDALKDYVEILDAIESGNYINAEILTRKHIVKEKSYFIC